MRIFSILYRLARQIKLFFRLQTSPLQPYAGELRGGGSMPQLVRGGKHVFGWSRVREGGTIAIPPEALQEYCLREGEEMVMLPGSRTSGGFGLARRDALQSSALGAALEGAPRAGEHEARRGRAAEERRPHPRVRLAGGTVTVGPEELERYGVGIGDRLLVARGSGLAVGFAVRGPIVEEAGRHPELKVF
jgi:hypothetical protein